ncbi:MAG TPA: ATP-dependent DNA helicase [Candidatus Baltobacteraceae bacterium]|jgi:ATP-dependent DNA helicase DinG|nr:ATP-dependent DNA helicase [Candidatus Baltobacteraceae bacterium]
MIAIDDVFAPGGPIECALQGFEPRPGQVQMAQLIERGFLEGMHTIVEAGTGVGKSLAYLVPVLRSGKKVVLSTGTIALQEQLFYKDIPLVTQALGVPARVTLLKGRNHYLCKQKLERLQTERLLASSRSMQQLWEWGARTQTGDRAELPFSPPSDEWEQLDADADDCVGEFCDHFRDCFFFKKRDEAKFADVVVVNHALFFLDLAMGGGLLPPYDYAVLDEAHQCERWATAALTATLSRSTIGRMLRKLHRTYSLPGHFDSEFESGVRGLESALARVPGDRYPLHANEEASPALDSLRNSLFKLENWLYANWHDALKRRPQNDAEAERRRDLSMRSILAHEATIERAQQPPETAIAWVERGENDSRYEINSAPFDVADFLQAALFARTPSVVLTSATIANAAAEQGGAFDFLKRSLGVPEAQELIAPSPFDYPRQARLYVAPPQLNPKAPDFARRAAPLVEECLDRSRGRAFVLFTSYARLREVYALVRERIPFPIRLQGELPRTHLLDWFRSTPNAVLFATGTFWEGIDVVGEQLSCVIIDRLPFPSPADPLVQARIEALEASGENGFDAYMIPSAIVRLKQGFGRLIRSKQDRGLVALLDGRAASSRYGHTILRALPPARRLTHLDELTGFFGTAS